MKINSLLFSTLILCLIFVNTQAKNYAVLLAGSSGQENYFDQANIYHAYRILIDQGFHPDNIITFAYDDLAFSHANPFYGKVFNRQSMEAGINYYKGVKINYRGEDITPEFFLEFMEGIGEKSNQFLKSSLNDRIFVYISANGADMEVFKQAIPFPNGKKLSNVDFIYSLNTMYKNKKFKEMIIFIDTYYGAALFQNTVSLPQNTLIMTSTNATAFSTPRFCGENSFVNNITVTPTSCLATQFSNFFLSYLEEMDKNHTTFNGLGDFLNVYPSVDYRVFGDVLIARRTLGDFIGDNKSGNIIKVGFFSLFCLFISFFAF